MRRRDLRRRRLALVAGSVAGLLLISPLAAQAAPTTSPSASPTSAATPQAGSPSDGTSTPTSSGSATSEATSSPKAGPTSTAQQSSGSTSARAKAKAVPNADPAQPNTVGVKKSNNLAGAPLTPGKDFTYNFVVTCSGLTQGCINQTFTDTLPAGLDVTDLPGSTSTRTVTYDAATRKLTIAFKEPLQNPPGDVGLNDGRTVNLLVGMRLPPETPITNGTVISNTASTADNAPEASSSNNIPVSIPRVVNPVTTKDWADGSAVAGTNEPSTITLGVRNASSTSAQISSLTITDSTPATFQNFDFTGATVAGYPAGADRAVLQVCTAALSACTNYTAGPATAAPGTDLALPAGIAASAVTGLRVVFTNAAGDYLPYDATGGSVKLGMVLRDTVRSTDAPLRPTNRETVNNCAVPSAVDAVQGDKNGSQACKGYDILPDTLTLSGSKRFFADTDGNFENNNGEYAVVGQHSRVAGVVNVANKSPFPIAELRITEPSAAKGNEFDKLDTDAVRLRYPKGATSATLVVTYNDGTTATFSPADNTRQPVAKPGARVTGFEVTYRGAAGDATIVEGAVAGVDLSGTLNDLVTDADLPNGTSPGVGNCAGFFGDAGRNNGTGTAVGDACATLDVKQPITSSTGTKSVGQTSVPLGQPIPFTLRVSNNGTLPLVAPVISDPPVGANGNPDPTAPNPFAQLSLTSASISQDPNTPAVIIEVFDPTAGAWAPYDATNTDLLARATGVRARMDGNLIPTKSFTLNLVTERRPGTADDVSILNCFSSSAEGYTAPSPACAPRIQSGPANESGSLNKSISPSTLPREIPGVPEQYADVILTLRNNGNLSMGTLQATDLDADFFNEVDFVDFKPVKFPAGADRIQIDAYVNGAWVTGTPATTAALPAGVAAVDVRGIRATFSSSGSANGGFLITPCAPTDRSCAGSVDFRISPRVTVRNTSDPVPPTLTNTVDGAYTTYLHPDPAAPKTIPAVDATLTLVAGTPKIDVDKNPNTVVGPGETAPFNLVVTNNGTANIPQLSVADLLPAGLAFDPSFNSDLGYKIIDTKVPTGTEPVPTPTFDTTTDPANPEHVASLRFNFGDTWLFRPGSTFTIQIQVTLEPGLTVGQTLTNTMGATAPSLVGPGACTVGDPVITDGDFGPGTYCTHSAPVTVKAGAAFAARKWVRGRDSLGWFDTRTGQPVGRGARSCPSTTDAEGNLYTAYPCIALVNPGDQYHYFVRLTNAGTEAATEMRLIDRLPVAGDKGVILNQDRGTEWDNRPTLASEPVLDGPGGPTLANSYTDGAICADDVSTDPTDPKCPAGDWNAGFGPANTGIQMRLTFPARLAPGASVGIRFDMTTPDLVTRVSDPTIAWNSFAHAETTLHADGTPNYLPPTEPIKVGVGLAYGTLAVTKVIGENPSNLPLADLEFGFHYTCTILPQGGQERQVADGDLVAKPGETPTVTGIPGGSTCRVWETQSYGGVSDATEANPKVVTINPYLSGDTGQVTTVSVTNDFPDAVIALRKILTGAAAQFGRDSYPVDLTCTFNGTPLPGLDPEHLNVPPGTEEFAVKVPTGASCTAVETDTGQATEVTYDPAAAAGTPGSGPVTAQSGKPQTITVTNEFRGGGLQISKEVQGPGAPELSNGPFTFDVSCRFDNRDIYATTVTLKGDGTGKTLTSGEFPRETPAGPLTLPVGSVCTITETDTGGANAIPDAHTVTIPDEVDGVQQVENVGFTNVFSAGTLSLTKDVTGPGADQPWATGATFTVDVTCQREDAAGDLTTVYSGAVPIKGGETLKLASDGTWVSSTSDAASYKLPLGSRCFGQETGTGGSSSHSVNHDSYENALVVGPSSELQNLQLVATNTFDVTALTVTKHVNGPGAGFAAGRTFTVAVTCTLDQGGTMPTVVLNGREFQLKANASVGLRDLPVGAKCVVTEPDDGGATSTTILTAGDVSTPVPVSPTSPVTLPPDGTGVIVTNTFEVGHLVVKKLVVNGKPGPYSLTVTCTTDQGPVNLGADAAFSLRAGQSRSITVPTGAACTVAEANLPAKDRVSFTDSDGNHDGKVTVNGDASVVVTNTFAETPPPTTPPPTTPPPTTPPTTTPPTTTPTQPGTGGGTQPPSSGSLAGTGGPSGALWVILAGVLVLGGGAGLLAAASRRTRRLR